MILDAQRADQPGPAEIELDMEFAEEGGEGATPYEVLLHAALVGDSTYFTRQDNVEQSWRIVQPLLDSPPPCSRTQRARGGRRRPTSWWPGTAAGTGRGCRPGLRSRARIIDGLDGVWTCLAPPVRAQILPVLSARAGGARHAQPLVNFRH